MKEQILKFIKEWNESHIEKITHEFFNGELKYCLSLYMLNELVEQLKNQ